MTHGFRRAGVSVVAGVDLDPACRYPYEANNPGTVFLERDIAELDGREIRALYTAGSVRVLIGCAPCQPFSRYTYRMRRHAQWGMLSHFSRLVKQVKPDIVSMENVPELLTRGRGVYRRFVRTLERAGYHVSAAVLDCAKYGIPQRRRRLVLLASLHAAPGIPPVGRRAATRTVRDAIAGLPPIGAGERAASDPLHRASRLSEVNLRRIRSTPAGGTWRDWDPALRLRCHKRKSGRKYVGVYGRMTWDAPSPTITSLCYGLGNGRFGHPSQDRAISLREAALLQTFPRRYRFAPPKTEVTMKTAGRLIGNAVPVRLAEVLGRHIVRHVSRVQSRGVLLDGAPQKRGHDLSGAPGASRPARRHSPGTHAPLTVAEIRQSRPR